MKKTTNNYAVPVDAQPDTARSANGPLWLLTTLQDLRFALRTLRKSPAFAVTAIFTLALGIGANTAIFQLLDAVRLRSLPVADPASLVRVQIKGGIHDFGWTADDTALSTALWEQIRKQQQAFTGFFAWRSTVYGIGRGEQERVAQGLWVSGEMFPILGIVPVKGRLFTPEDDRADCGTSGAVISYGLWQNEFGGKDSVIGSRIVVYGHPTQVIGVTPPGFFGLDVGKEFEVALPTCSVPAYIPGDGTLIRRDVFWLQVMGRLKPGWSLQQASAQLDAASPGMFEATVPDGYSTSELDTFRKFRLTAYSGSNGISAPGEAYDTPLWLLLGTTGLVLLIACANLANLMLVRASTREKEMAVRLALGASSGRVLRQLLLESLVLAVIGSVLGIGLASFLSRTVVRMLGTERDPFYLATNIDWRVLSFTALVAVSTCLLFGLVPAFRSSRVQPGAVLKSGGRGMTAGRQKFSFQQTLVVSQIAFSLVLLVGALLFVRSFWNLMTLDPGFRETGILRAYLNFRRLDLPPERYETFKHEILEQIRSIPLVESAATSTHVPLDGGFFSLGVRSGATQAESKFTWVSPGYFRTMQIPFVAGRDFTERDTTKSQPVAIVNETFVRQFIGGGNPLGKTIRTLAEPHYAENEYEIVGVVKDAKYGGLRDEIPPEAFAPAQQYPERYYFTNAFIRFSSPPSAVISALREKLNPLYPEMKIEYHVFQTEIQNGLVQERLMALLSGFFGALAALLAMIGLYGVISYIIAMRRNEIGIRMALGASRKDVIGIVLRQTLALLALGVGIGVLLAVAATSGARTLLYGLRPSDPASLLGAAFFLALVALAASLWPAYRATRHDPMKALRYE
ncbi:MAG TPA: ABC transporter permease [Candidatus Acidoferrum sp.]|nr:ABC transporter permease [Candidatus Acidoferrum sp.]